MNCDIEERTTEKGNSCNARKLQEAYPEMLHCTRARGHTGKHHAHNQYGKCYGQWEGNAKWEKQR